MTKIISLFISLLFCAKAYSIVEIGGNYSYQKQIYGANRENSIRSKDYSANMAFYLWDKTALEFNYSKGEKIITDNVETIIPSANLAVTSTQQIIGNNIFGVGLKQAFAGRKSRIIPSVSIGYAKQFTSTQTERNYRVISTGTAIRLKFDPAKSRSDNIFASFSLKIKLTRMLSLTGGVKTYFRAFEFSEAKDDLKYSAGFSWFL